MLEPTWRSAWVARLNLLWLKSNPPTRAIIAPFCGLMETSAELTSGSWDSHQLSPTLRTQICCPACTTSLTLRGVAPCCVSEIKRRAQRTPSIVSETESPLANSATASWAFAEVTTAGKSGP